MIEKSSLILSFNSSVYFHYSYRMTLIHVRLKYATTIIKLKSTSNRNRSNMLIIGVRIPPTNAINY